MISGVNVVSLEPYTLEDVFGDVRSIAAALGVAHRGDGVVRQVRAAQAGSSVVQYSRFEFIIGRPNGRAKGLVRLVDGCVCLLAASGMLGSLTGPTGRLIPSHFLLLRTRCFVHHMGK